MSTYGIVDCANLQIFELATGKPFLYSNYANVATNEWSSERVYANAKGSRAIAWDNGKTGTLTVELETFDLKWLAMLAGSEMTTGEKNIARREVISVSELKKATLKDTPVVGSVQVIKVGMDKLEHIGEPLEEIVLSETVTEVGSGQFAIEASEITFATDAVDGEFYAVYYLAKESGVKSFTVSTDKFPKAFRDAMIREKETGKDEFVQIEYLNARPQGNFTFTMSATEPTALSVTFDLFPVENVLAEYSFIIE